MVTGFAMLGAGYVRSVSAYEPLVPENYTITVIADALNHPWSLACLPDGRLLVTERRRQPNIIDEGKVYTALA